MIDIKVNKDKGAMTELNFKGLTDDEVAGEFVFLYHTLIAAFARTTSHSFDVAQLQLMNLATCSESFFKQICANNSFVIQPQPDEES